MKIYYHHDTSAIPEQMNRISEQLIPVKISNTYTLDSYHLPIAQICFFIKPKINLNNRRRFRIISLEDSKPEQHFIHQPSRNVTGLHQLA